MHEPSHVFDFQAWLRLTNYIKSYRFRPERYFGTVAGSLVGCYRIVL